MGVVSTLAGASKSTILHARTVLVKTACFADRLCKGLGSSGVLSLQALLITGNVLFFTAGENSYSSDGSSRHRVHSSRAVGLNPCRHAAAGLKARKRAQFAAAVQCITDLDDDGLRLVLGYIPGASSSTFAAQVSLLQES